MAHSDSLAPIYFVIRYPNGDKQRTHMRVDETGYVRYVYIQPRHKVRAGRRTAHVRVTVIGPFGPVALERTYKIL
ncbi:MAG: hypothetical protein NVS9B15_17380 [Acidobacteriaceae bacterium]